MSARQVFTCNACGAVKQSTNNWWMVHEHKQGLKIEPWDEVLSPIVEIIHVCGEQCALRVIAEWMDKKVREHQLVA